MKLLSSTHWSALLLSLSLLPGCAKSAAPVAKAPVAEIPAAPASESKAPDPTAPVAEPSAPTPPATEPVTEPSKPTPPITPVQPTPPVAKPPKVGAPAATNLQVLPKRSSKQQITRIMRGMSKGLGVQCAHCHNPKDFSSDALPNKLAARKMLKMTRSLNRQFMGGKNRVTCNSCHRGKSNP